MAIEVLPLGKALGAEVRCGDLRALDDVRFREVRAAWLDHLVLLFRGQDLDDAELTRFGERFGVLVAGSKRFKDIKPRPREFPYINVISNVIGDDGIPIGNLGFGEAVWHTDMSYIAEPPDGSILHALEVPASGGNTSFCNMYLAYETLPADLREAVKGRQLKHDASYNSAGRLRPDCVPVTDVTVSPGPVHPLVRTHPETGHDALFLGRRPHGYVAGLPVPESESLLDALWAHAAQPRFAWSHEWRKGDVLVWDNRCAMHHREAFDPKARRIMHRTQISGTRPFHAPEAAGRGRHARGIASA